MPNTFPIGGATIGGSTLTRGQRPTDGIKVPGYDAAYYWQVLTGSPAIGQATIGGRMSVLLPSAGLLAAPDSASASVTVSLWWAYASAVEVVRVDPDGTRTPVRASPVLLDRSASRRNVATNPRSRDDLTGYAAGDANSTLSRIAGLDTPIPQATAAARVTAAAAGTVSLRSTLDSAGTIATTYSWLVRTSATATTLGVTVRWYDETGQDVGAQTYPVTAAVRASAAARWTWATATVDSSPAGAVVGVLSYTASGMPAAGTMDVTARLTETTGGGDYFDGDQLGASWIGTPGISASDLAPVVVVVDAEAPLDTPVRYELSSGAAPGFVAASETVTVDAGRLHFSKRQCLLTHPGLDRTIQVWVEDDPQVSNDLEQQAFAVKGRRRKVVVSEAERSGDEGTITFVAETFDERDRLLDVLDGTPVLLRMPASYGHPPLWWVSIGKLDIRGSRNATRQLRRISGSFIEVDRPAVAQRFPAA